MIVFQWIRTSCNLETQAALLTYSPSLLSLPWPVSHCLSNQAPYSLLADFLGSWAGVPMPGILPHPISSSCLLQSFDQLLSSQLPAPSPPQLRAKWFSSSFPPVLSHCRSLAFHCLHQTAVGSMTSCLLLNGCNDSCVLSTPVMVAEADALRLDQQGGKLWATVYILPRSPCRASPRTKVPWLGKPGSHLGSSLLPVSLTWSSCACLKCPWHRYADLNWQDLKIKLTIPSLVERTTGSL